MGSRRSFLGISAALLAASGLSLVACAAKETDSTPDYRYRLTVEVETPQGLKTGSSVIEVKTSVASSYSIPSPGAVNWRVRGEAVAVDLPGGRTLFALLRSENDADWASRVIFMLAPDGPHDAEDSFLARYNNMMKLKGPITLPRMWPPMGGLPERSAYPMLVTFGDTADPTSVARVDPDELSASFGGGVKLRRITVEMTQDQMTLNLRDRLGWLSSVRGAISPVGNSERPPLGSPLPLHATLTEMDFTKDF